MTDQPWRSGEPSTHPGSTGSPPPYPPSQPYGAAGANFDASAPYGRHPISGQPYSDKSKLIGGLLQLLGMIGIVGIGRIYIGHTGLGITQLLVGLLSCGLAAVAWGLIDALLILTDNVSDPYSRPLRDGT